MGLHQPYSNKNSIHGHDSLYGRPCNARSQGPPSGRQTMAIALDDGTSLGGDGPCRRRSCDAGHTKEVWPASRCMKIWRFLLFFYCNMPLKRRATRTSSRVVHPPAIPPPDTDPWSDESSDCDPSYVPPPDEDDESLTTSVTESEYSAAVESDSDSSS